MNTPTQSAPSTSVAVSLAPVPRVPIGTSTIETFVTATILVAIGGLQFYIDNPNVAVVVIVLAVLRLALQAWLRVSQAKASMSLASDVVEFTNEVTTLDSSTTPGVYGYSTSTNYPHN